MGKAITELKTQAKHDNRVSVYLDGQYGFGLHRALAAPLQIGQELTQREIEQLKRSDQRESAYQRAVRSIARRPRSVRELQTAMRRQGLEPADVEQVVGRLEQAGLADDLEFARAWIENRMTFRPRGALALKSELSSKGISSRTIGRALQSFSEAEAARRAAAQGARRYQQLSPDDFRRRLSAYLSRRGFDYQTVSPLVRELAAERALESEEPK